MLTSTLELIVNNEPTLQTNLLQRIGPDAAYYLSSSAAMDTYSETNFVSTLDAANLVHEAIKHDAGFLQQHYLLANEKHFKAHPPVRAWNALALTALSTTGSLPAFNLIYFLPSFAVSFATSLRPLSIISIHAPPETYSLELNQAFTAIKLWLLLCRKMQDVGTTLSSDDRTALGARDDGSEEESRTERRIWNELWPPFERILVTSMSDIGGQESTPLNLAIWTSFAEIVIFIYQIRSPIALDASVAHVSMLKELMKHSKSDSANNKFTRALKCVQQPPNDVTMETMVAQARAELLGAEKLSFALETRQTGVERSEKRYERRRDIRTGH